MLDAYIALGIYLVPATIKCAALKPRLSIRYRTNVKIARESSIVQEVFVVLKGAILVITAMAHHHVSNNALCNRFKTQSTAAYSVKVAVKQPFPPAQLQHIAHLTILSQTLVALVLVDPVRPT